MALLTDNVDIPLDDYEEGEILDEDNLFKDVSSSEEFSVEETDTNEHLQLTSAENSLNKSVKKVKQHRKKEHRCKEDSICRLERSGKHCYARIKTGKTDSNLTPKAGLITANSSTDTENSRKRTVSGQFKREQGKFKPCPALKIHRPIPAPKSLYRNDYRDVHDRDDRYGYKRCKIPTEKFLNDRFKYLDKNKIQRNRRETNRSFSPKYQTGGPPRNNLSVDKQNENCKENSSVSKSSLFKRLVGSGSTGLKALTEDEDNCKEISLLKDDRHSPVTSESEEGKASLPISGEEGNSSTLGYDSTVPSETHSIDKLVQTPAQIEPPKKIEVKWKRSMKDDKDELCLRVEALKSALLKKYTERKRKGLVNQKKSSNEVNDSLVEFVLGDDSDEYFDEEAVQKDVSKEEESKETDVCSIVSTDISGDVLKSEDMVIDSADKNDSQVICDESAIKMETDCNSQSVPLYFPADIIHSFTKLDTNINSYSLNQISNVSSLSCIPGPNFGSALPLYVCKRNIDLEPQLYNDSLNINSYVTNSQLSKNHLTSKSVDMTPSDKSMSLKKDSEKKKKRKKRVKLKALKRRSSTYGIKETNDLEEEKLREIALKSVKVKSKSQTHRENLTEIESKFAQTTILSDDSSLCLTPQTSSQASTVLEDELDEDILRAQLLCSLGKQEKEKENMLQENENTTIFTSSLSFPQNKKIQNRKIFKPIRKKIKDIPMVKIWKQNFLPLVSNGNISQGGGAYLKKSTQCNKQLKNLPPVPKVAKLVISVNSDSSEDEETLVSEDHVKTTSDIEANIEQLLREAELEATAKGDKTAELQSSSLKSEVSENSLLFISNQEENDSSGKGNGSNIPVQRDEKTPKQTKLPLSPLSSSQSTNSSTALSGAPETPQALRHLPAWQQEEYKMLKKKMAEREKKLQLARAKLIAKPKIEKHPNILIPNTVAKDVSMRKLQNSGSENLNLTLAKVGNGKAESSFSVESSAQCQKENLSTENICSISDNSITKNSKSNILQKKTNTSDFDSTFITEELKTLENVLLEFTKNANEYDDLKERIERLRKMLDLEESKVALKMKKLFRIKDKFGEEEKKLNSKISSMAATHYDLQKQSNRDMEIVQLKFKQVSLKAKLQFHKVLNDKRPANKEDGAAKKANLTTARKFSFKKQEIPKCKYSTGGVKAVGQSNENKSNLGEGSSKETSENILKRNFSGKERDGGEWDPNKPMCHFDLNGICRDEECNYQHFKTV